MTNNLGAYFREQRLQQGLTLGELARRVGYRNVTKGSNKIIHFEREGVVTEDRSWRWPRPWASTGWWCLT